MIESGGILSKIVLSLLKQIQQEDIKWAIIWNFQSRKQSQKGSKLVKYSHE